MSQKIMYKQQEAGEKPWVIKEMQISELLLQIRKNGQNQKDSVPRVSLCSKRDLDVFVGWSINNPTTLHNYLVVP